MTTTTAGGTPLYMAPELLDPNKFGKTNSRPTQPADMYAFGMVIYEVLTGFDPFYDKNYGTFQFVRPVLDGARPTKPDNAEKIGFGSGSWELVKECWKAKSTKRPTIERVLMHLARVSVPQILHPGNFRSPSIGHDQQLFLTDPQTILSQWRRLTSRDHQQIATLVDNKENRDIALEFRGKDAVTVISTIGKVSQPRCFISATATHGIHLSICPEGAEAKSTSR
jgi:serine/threonine protein kinase